jgi:acyl transferase domain-containing protein
MPGLRAHDVGRTLALGRTAFRHRAVVLPGDRGEQLAALAALASGGKPARAVYGGAAAPPSTAYLFTGQGSQRPRMGAELYEFRPVFAKALDEVCEAFEPVLARPLKSLLFAAEGSPEAALLERTEYAQPALFAIETALFRLLEQSLPAPGQVAGHSIGGLAAVHAAGALSLEDACTLVAARGRLMQAMPGGGAMVACEASEEEVRGALAGYEGRVGVAAVNGPLSTVVSGDADAVAEVADVFRERGRRTRRLRVSHAFHSHHMDGALDEVRAVVARLRFHEPLIPVVSDLTGRRTGLDELRQPDYWAHQLRVPVRFGAAVVTLAEAGATAFVEVGPDAVLTPLVAACLPGTAPLVVPSQVRDRRGEETFAVALSTLHAAGGEVRWESWYAEQAAPPAELPTYPFEHTHHWWPAPAGTQPKAPPAPDPAEAATPRPPGDGASLLDLVRLHAADVLGHESPESIAAEDNFLDIGFSSFTALEVRNRLCEATGLLLPPVLLFDHPTPSAVAGFIRDELAAA